MTREPNWTEEEFRTVLSNPKRSDEELSAESLDRTPGAIGFVRAGIHDFHNDCDNSILSATMKEVLRNSKEHWLCPVCQQVIT